MTPTIELTDPFAPARYATTVWGLHLASFRYGAPYIFPGDIVTEQTALVVRTWNEAEILIKAAFPDGRKGILCTMGGRDPQGHPVDPLMAIHPWAPGAHEVLTRDPKA